MIMNGLSQGGGSNSRVPVIYTTNYLGTGTWGVNNPNTLTFDFVPEFIWIYWIDQSFKSNGGSRTVDSLIRISSNSSSGGPTNFPFCMCNTLTTDYKNYQGFSYFQSDYSHVFIKKSEDGKTISWYYDANYSVASLQFNSNDQNYNYIYYVLAIGYKEEV